MYKRRSRGTSIINSEQPCQVLCDFKLLTWNFLLLTSLVRISSVSLQDFRNVELARLRLEGDAVFVVGPNGQGKTNLLEAIGLVTALRSFRTTETKALIRWGKREARVLCELQHEHEGTAVLDIRLRPRGKEIELDGSPVPRLAAIIGHFPTVALSSHDIQLLRGGPGLRRRFLDLLLAGADPCYFDCLRRYTRALKERNALLKAGRSGGELAAFEVPLAAAAVELVQLRRAALVELQPLVEATYRGIATTEESPGLDYKPDVDAQGTADRLDAAAEVYRELLNRNRARDLALQSTSRGPHRDDIELRLLSHGARDYGSEGQQRGLVLALRLAQARWLEQRDGIVPVILADDILGELDPRRRTAFWQVLNPQSQVIATGTQLPADAPGRAWQLIEVDAGQFSA